MASTSDIVTDVVTFGDEASFRARAAEAFERHAARVRALVPGARVEHVGSTAVPGVLTKGDVDLCVLVPAARIADAAAALASAYADNVGSERNEHLASFVAPGEDVGVQLVAEGSAFDTFVRWRELLRASPDLRRDYDALKRRHDGGDMRAYRVEKASFVEAALAATATFEEALAGFIGALRAAGWPERILWTRAQDVARGDDGVIVYLGPDADDAGLATRDFGRERGAGRAPRLAAVCAVGDATCAIVTTSGEPAVPAAIVPGQARWPVC